MSPTYRFVSLVTVTLLVAIPVWLLWPGVTGPFLFDDFVTIGRLGVSGCVEDFDSFINYVLGGHNASGRPLAYISFLMQDHCWPTSAEPFKQFNVLWHALNGLLVFWLLLELFCINRERTTLMVLGAFAGALWWTTNIIHQEAIFLTVQRMTLMSSTCVLLGLLGYVKATRDGLWNWFGKAAWVGAFTVTGILFKEQAVLLPLFVLVLEYTVCQPLGGGFSRQGRKCFRIAMMAPLLTALVYLLAFRMDRIEAAYAGRDFSMSERLLTEARILFDYLRRMLLPSMKGIGIYHDDIVVSTGLFTPVSTFFAVFAWLGAAIFALVFRQRFRWFSLGILFFFAGHALESTFIPLELYYQHRNYIAALGVIFFVAPLFMSGAVIPELKKGAGFLVVGLLILAVVIGRVQAGYWGDFSRLATIWVAEQPESPRILRQSARILWEEGERWRALDMILGADGKFDHSISGRLTYSVLVCNEQAGTYLEEITREAPGARYTHAFREASMDLLTQAKTCEHIDMTDYREFIQALMKNPKARSHELNLRWMSMAIAQSYAHERDLDRAMMWQDKAYEARPDPYVAYTQALWLITAGLYEEALEYARKANNTCRSLKFICLKGTEDTKRLVNMLEEKVNNDAKTERGDSGEERSQDAAGAAEGA